MSSFARFCKRPGSSIATSSARSELLIKSAYWPRRCFGYRCHHRNSLIVSYEFGLYHLVHYSDKFGILVSMGSGFPVFPRYCLLEVFTDIAEFYYHRRCRHGSNYFVTRFRNRRTAFEFRSLASLLDRARHHCRDRTLSCPLLQEVSVY